MRFEEPEAEAGVLTVGKNWSPCSCCEKVTTEQYARGLKSGKLYKRLHWELFLFDFRRMTFRAIPPQKSRRESGGDCQLATSTSHAFLELARIAGEEYGKLQRMHQHVLPAGLIGVCAYIHM